jgi:GTP-binding protein YchF
VKQVGIVGAPYSGKTTFFNALTHAGAGAGGGGKANIAIVPVPDERVDELTRLHASRKSVYAQLKFVDVAGLTKGSGAGEGLSGQILGALREADALAIVVRAYGEDADPASELADLMLELTLADLTSIGSAADRAARKVRVGDKAAGVEVELLKRATAVLEEGKTLRSATWEPEELTVFRNFQPLTLKPAVVVLNVDDEGAGDDAAKLARELAATVHADAEGMAVPARLEAEVGGMDADEAAELLKEFGVETGALPQVVESAYRMLGLLTFLTAGEDESRAWEVRSGATAPEAAGVIHSDLQRGFIRAEVVGYGELVSAGSWDKAKAAGKLRVEGKDYVVREGDVMNIRFAV